MVIPLIRSVYLNFLCIGFFEIFLFLVMNDLHLINYLLRTFVATTAQ